MDGGGLKKFLSFSVGSLGETKAFSEDLERDSIFLEDARVRRWLEHRYLS